MANALATLLVKIGADISDLQTGLQSAQRNLEATGKRMTEVGKTLSTRLTAPITAFGALSVRAFGQQEQAERKLAAAIRATGGQVDSNMRRFTAFASEMQRLTVVGDETTLALLQVATTQGLTADSAERAVRNAIAMQSAFNVNAESAIRMTAALEQGDATMLRRYIPALRGVEDQAEAVARAHEILGGAFGIAQEEAQTTSGQIAQLRNAFGDFMEQIGGVIAEALLPLIARLKQGVEFLQAMDKATLRTTVAIAGLLAGIGPVIVGFGLLAKAIAFMISPIGLTIAGLAALSATIMYVYDNWGALTERFSDIGWWRNAIIDMYAFFIDHNVFALILDEFNKLLSVFRIPNIPNPFNVLSDSLRKLKVETNEYEHEFGSLSDAIRNSISALGNIALRNIFGDTAIGEVEQLTTAMERASFTALQFGESSRRGFEQVETGANQVFQPIFSLGSYMADVLTPVVRTFTASFGQGMANVVLQGERLTDVLRNIGRLLASAAIQRGLQILLTGGLASAGDGFFGKGGGLFGRIFGTTFMNDGMITSTGNIVKFHPNDNILAMKDFGNLIPDLNPILNISTPEPIVNVMPNNQETVTKIVEPSSGISARELTQALNGINWQLRGDTLYAVGTRGGVRYER